MNSDTASDPGGSPGLGGLIGRSLSAVVFVQDYLQLQFDGDLLTILTWPTIVMGQDTFRFGSGKYRDVLCERISRIVVQADVRHEREAVLTFSDGSTLVIPIDDAAHLGPEVLIYSPENGPKWTF
jgi:hypothetical protein